EDGRRLVGGDVDEGRADERVGNGGALNRVVDFRSRQRAGAAGGAADGEEDARGDGKRFAAIDEEDGGIAALFGGAGIEEGGLDGVGARVEVARGLEQIATDDDKTLTGPLGEPHAELGGARGAETRSDRSACAEVGVELTVGGVSSEHELRAG